MSKVGGAAIPLFEMVYRDCVALYGKYGYDKPALFTLRSLDLCPTDKKNLERKRAARSNVRSVSQPFTNLPRRRGGSSAKRDFSYALNCSLCHVSNLSAFGEPSKTLLFAEANLGPNDYSGVVTPGVESVAFRHLQKSHLLFGDIHIEILKKDGFNKAAQHPQFYSPSPDSQRR